MKLIDIIIYTGTFVFAMTGALKARAHRMDLFGAIVIAFVTAYGGGTIRDLLIGIRPVNWVNDNVALVLVLSAVLIVLVIKKSFLPFRKAIFITDAIGLGLFTIAGIEKSLNHEINVSYAIVMGVISSTFGGLLADILCNNVPDLLKRGELYATASLIGGIIYVLLRNTELSQEINQLISVCIVVSVRFISKIKRLTLPDI